MRLVIEWILVCTTAGFFGTSAHEMTHYYVVRQWTDDVHIGFNYGFPQIVQVENLLEFSERQVRLFCIAPMAIWGAFAVLLFTIRRPTLSLYHLGYFLAVILAATPSQADLFGVLYPAHFQREGDKRDFSNWEATVFIYRDTLRVLSQRIPFGGSIFERRS